MTPYGWAWVIVGVAVPVALFALHRATRGMPLPRTRRLIGALLAVWAVLPAPIPDYPGHYAPAFLVFAFETLFQRPGDPTTSGVILAAGTVATLGVALLLVSRRRKAGD